MIVSLIKQRIYNLLSLFVPVKYHTFKLCITRHTTRKEGREGRREGGREGGREEGRKEGRKWRKRPRDIFDLRDYYYK